MGKTNVVPAALSQAGIKESTLIMGAAGSGKTATILKPLVYQLLLQKKQGRKLGLTILEPRPDLTAMVAEMFKEMDIPCIHLKLADKEQVEHYLSESEINKHFEEGTILSIWVESRDRGFERMVAARLEYGAAKRKNSAIPHYMVFEEYYRYINSETEEFLSVLSDRNIIGFFTFQLLRQMEVETKTTSGEQIKKLILDVCPNRVLFPRHPFFVEAYELFGIKDQTAIELLYHPKFDYIYQLSEQGELLRTAIGKGEFVPDDWKERKEWERRSFRDRFKNWFDKGTGTGTGTGPLLRRLG